MSIGKVLVFVLLALLAYVGVYMMIYGAERYMLYSGTERNYNLMSGSELQPNLNVKGDIETVIYLLHTETVSSDILGFPMGSVTRYYYVLPIGYQNNSDKQQYCTIAVSDPDDVAAVERLMKNTPVPLDPDAPRFEFRGMALDMPTEVYQKFKAYLESKYTNNDIGVGEFNMHDIIFGANVDYNLVPYTIFVKGKNDDNFMLPIGIGGACAILGIGLFILLAVRTYRKKHKYD